MALTTTFVLQGTSPTTIEATDFLAFSDGTFGNPVAVSSYNGGTHVRSSAGADDSDGNTPNNVKYVASGTGDWGDGTEALSGMLDGEATLKITIAYDTNITVTDITMYAYDGSTTTNAPTDMAVQMAEQGDSAWTQAHGSGSALSITDSSTPATSHDFYVAVSASPSTVGVKSANKARIEFTYQ
jgi:hypothetical protein